MILAEGGRRFAESPLVWAPRLAACVIAGIVIAFLPLDRAPVLTLVAAVVPIAVMATLRRPRSLVVVGATLYVSVLHWVYVDWVSPLYSYYGTIAVGVEWPALVLVTFLAALPALWLPIELRRPSDVVLWFLYLFGYVPACSVPIHILGPEPWPVLPFLAVLTTAFATLGLMRIPPKTLKWTGLSERAFERVLAFLGVSAAAYLILVFGVPTGLPDLSAVYDVRSDYTAVASVTLGVGYIVPWAGNVIYPFIIALGLARWRGRLIMLGVAGELLVYATTGLKTVFFSILLVPLLYVVMRYAKPCFGALLVWGGVAVIALSIAATVISGSLLPLALFVQRLLAVPGQVTAYYYDFFSSHETFQLSRSFLRWFVSAPYDIDPADLIGIVYLEPGTNANANVWADAMANFGLVGIIPFTLVLGAVLWVLDSVTVGRDLRVVGPTLGLAGITLGNGGLFTSILTLGIGLTIGLIALMPRTGSDDADETPGMPRAP